MELLIFTANQTGNKKNCYYPNRVVAKNAAELQKAVMMDHVCAEYRNDYRSNANFMQSVVAVMDCDNDHFELPGDWMTPDKLKALLPTVAFAIAPSRSNMKEKDGKLARPRFHVYFFIPASWKVEKLLNVVSWESNSQPPKSKFIYEPKEGYIRFIQNRDYDSDNHKTYIPYTSSLSTVTRFDILMDKYGDAGAVRYGIEGTFNVALGKIKVKNSNSQEYIRSFLQSEGVYSYLHNSCMASTRASLNESNLSMLNIVIPSNKVLLEYQSKVRKIRESILLTIDENQQLKKLRDWLLPMLINGQITISD